MAGLIQGITEGGRTSMDSRTNVDLQGQPFKTFKFNTDNTVSPRHQATILKEKNIGGDVLIWGNESFGIWGEFKWGTSASQSFILGLGILGLNALGDQSSEFEIVRIIPPGGVFEENFITDYFINTSETTVSQVIGGVIF
jgi:hypothetical protein